ncbi:hypothetical protein MB02_03500 [Croceicoccus estronivorus]|uniref:DOMON-like domain-containing protein n=1 Tax=Croceicoccus estronivorus TaxID=1172626 RepID=UPI00082FBEB1|nr:DOMON-like domain-containing protein [Croceicoccus estronivorus]OCC24568.1 hypothetical protein MB02_03500 [Croceicoccus estronivorus]
MGTHRLICHPDTPPAAVESVNVSISSDAKGGLLLRWRVAGCMRLVLPPYSGSGRADDLWKTTCFELFVRGQGDAYCEFNFSPSQRWAAYRFDGYRSGTSNLDLSDSPQIDHQTGERIFVLTAKIPRLPMECGGTQAGLSAVIEEQDGIKSFWALAHPPGQPDFHDPACFIAELPAPQPV